MAVKWQYRYIGTMETAKAKRDAKSLNAQVLPTLKRRTGLHYKVVSAGKSMKGLSRIVACEHSVKGG